MGCFGEILRFMKAPFKREKGRVIQIGYPTDFRKEELPPCFSDAESVLSPSRNPTERPNLTFQSQDPDAAEQLHHDHGEGRNHDRNDATIIVDEEQGSRPGTQDEHETIANRIRKCLNVSQWRRRKPTSRRKAEASTDPVQMQSM